MIHATKYREDDQNTKIVTVELPDLYNVFSHEEQDQLKFLVQIHNEIEKLEVKLAAQKLHCLFILKAKAATGEINKTVVFQGVEITHNLRRNFHYSQSVAEAEKIVDAAQGFVKRLKTAEIKNNIDAAAKPIEYISIKNNDELVFDKEKEVWISSYNVH